MKFSDKWKKILEDILGVFCWIAFLFAISFLISLGSFSFGESILLVFGISLGIVLIITFILKGISKFIEENHN